MGEKQEETGRYHVELGEQARDQQSCPSYHPIDPLPLVKLSGRQVPLSYEW